MTWTIGQKGEYGTYNANTIYDEEGNGVCLIYGLPVNKTLEDIASLPSSRRGLERARMIAAAPEMRDALAKIAEIAARIAEDAPDTFAGPIDEIRKLAEEATQ